MEQGGQSEVEIRQTSAPTAAHAPAEAAEVATWPRDERLLSSRSYAGFAPLQLGQASENAWTRVPTLAIIRAELNEIDGDVFSCSYIVDITGPAGVFPRNLFIWTIQNHTQPFA